MYCKQGVAEPIAFASTSVKWIHQCVLKQVVCMTNNMSRIVIVVVFSCCFFSFVICVNCATNARLRSIIHLLYSRVFITGKSMFFSSCFTSSFPLNEAQSLAHILFRLLISLKCKHHIGHSEMKRNCQKDAKSLQPDVFIYRHIYGF